MLGRPARREVRAFLPVGLSLFLVAAINLGVFPARNIPIVYAVPLLIAALRLAPRGILVTAVLAVALNMLSVIVERTPREVWPVTSVALLVICFAAYLLAQQREVAARRTQELEAVLDNMVEGVLVCDSTGRITLANQSAVRMLGVASLAEVRHELTELPELLRMRHRDGRPISPEEMATRRALTGQTVAGMEQVDYNPTTRRDIYLQVSAAPIRGALGEGVGAVTVIRDVTELSELERQKDEFVAVAAHELKTPVTVMHGYAEVLLRLTKELPPEARRVAAAIDRGAHRIDAVVLDLLEISRLQAGRLELTLSRVDLAGLVGEVVGRLALSAVKHRVQLVRAEPVVVQGDPERLEQVLANLVDNAVRYSPPGGDVEVALTARDGMAVVSVSDQGVGIPAAKQEHIFERFYRAHTNTPYDYGGMGVGLFISKEIVTRHGGQIWFESQEERGSVFYFSLPILLDDSPEVDGAPA